LGCTSKSKRTHIIADRSLILKYTVGGKLFQRKKTDSHFQAKYFKEPNTLYKFERQRTDKG